MDPGTESRDLTAPVGCWEHWDETGARYAAG